MTQPLDTVADAPVQPRPFDSSGAEASSASVLRQINLAHGRLEQVLFNLDAAALPQQQIVDIARCVAAAADRNLDVALACILLNQGEGSYAVRHCVDSALVALLVGRVLGLGSAHLLSVMAAALTMNVGMLQLHEQLQRRLNGISDTELAAIRAHPQQSVALLQRAGIDDPDWLTYVLLHHENEDGSGYPFGRLSADIPLGAKLVALADRYCARVSTRSYRRSLLPCEALNDILLADHASVDPMLSACFIRVLGIYPTGALVRLQSGEIGVVCGKGVSGSTPLVHVLAGADGNPLPEPLRRDSADSRYAVREMLSEEEAGVRFRMHQIWGDAARR